MWKVVFVTDHPLGAERCESTLRIISKRLKINPVLLTNERLKIYEAHTLPKRGLVQKIKTFNPRVVVFDLKEHLKPAQYNLLRESHIRLVNHNPGMEQHFDVNILPFRYGNTCACISYEGVEYAALHRDFYKNGIKIRRHATRIVINDINTEYWRDLFKDTGLKLTFISDLNPVCIKSHDLTIMPVDYTAIQSLATGIPTMLFARNEAENELAANLVNTNATHNLGLVFQKKPEEVTKPILKILAGFSKRRNMSYCAKCLVNRKTWDHLHKIFKKTLEG